MDVYDIPRHRIAPKWQIKIVKVVPIVAGSLGTVTEDIDCNMIMITIKCLILLLQEACLIKEGILPRNRKNHQKIAQQLIKKKQKDTID